MVQGWHKKFGIIALIVVLVPLLSGCDSIRRALGYKVPPPPIVETHLAPCMQPHRGSPHRDCSGEMTGYTPRPAAQRQAF